MKILPNLKIITQFLSESIFMASLGFVVCIFITLVAGPMMQTMLIESGSNDTSTSEVESTPQQISTLSNPQPYSRIKLHGFNYLVGFFSRCV